MKLLTFLLLLTTISCRVNGQVKSNPKTIVISAGTIPPCDPCIKLSISNMKPDTVFAIRKTNGIEIATRTNGVWVIKDTIAALEAFYKQWIGESNQLIHAR